MRASRSYEAQYFRLTFLIEEARPGRRGDAAYDAGNFAEAERWGALNLLDENIEMNFRDGVGHSPTSPADWKVMIQSLHNSLDMHGFEFRRGVLVDFATEREQRYEAQAREEARTSEPVITIDIVEPGQALGFVRDDQDDWSIYGTREDGVWTIWTDNQGSATAPTLAEALSAWARDEYGYSHGRATGGDEPGGKKIDICW